MKPELGTKEYTNTLIDQGKSLGLDLEQYRQNPVISSESLRGERAMDVTAPAPGVEASGLQGMLESGAQNFQTQATQQDEFSRNLQLEQTRAEKSKDRSLKDYVSGLMGSRGETERSDELYSQKGGVDDIQKELNKINQDILAEQAGLVRQVEELEKNRAGTFGGALQDQIEDVTRASLRKQADMSIIQMGIQGRYDSAKSIADRAVSVALEKQTNVNEALRVTYEDNKDLFTTAEQRAFETAQNDRERKLDEEKENMKSIYELAIDAQQNGAPTSLVQQALKAKTREEALGMVGQFVGLLDRRKAEADLANVYSQIAERNGVVNGVVQPSADIAAGGSIAAPGNEGVVTGDVVADLTNFFNQNKAKLTEKESSALGVIVSANQLAQNNSNGKFEGLGFGQIVPSVILGSKGTSNRQYLSAINLTTQQWASGASLTKEQTKEVMKLVPKEGDNDAQIQNKLNGLSNYMLGQIRAGAIKSGAILPVASIKYDFAGKNLVASPDGNGDVIEITD